MKYAIATALALFVAAPATAVQSWTGNQVLEDFEARPLGPTSITYPLDPVKSDLGVLSGGSVAAATAALPAASPSHVYTGTVITYDGGWGSGVHWAAVSALVSGSAPIRLRAWEFDQTPGQRLIADIWTTGNDVNTVLGFGDDFNWQHISRAEFSSDALFAMDDFRLGLPDALIGIPEPASWTMLIAGFGLTGAALRRRRIISPQRPAPIG